MAIKKVKFEYYITQQDAANIGAFVDFLILLNRMTKPELNRDTAVQLHGDFGRIRSIRVDKDAHLWFFHIVRTRDEDPPYVVNDDGSIYEKELNVDEHYVEHVSCMYDPLCKVFVIERNYNGLRKAFVQDYLMRLAAKMNRPEVFLHMSVLIGEGIQRIFRKGVNVKEIHASILMLKDDMTQGEVMSAMRSLKPDVYELRVYKKGRKHLDREASRAKIASLLTESLSKLKIKTIDEHDHFEVVDILEDAIVDQCNMDKEMRSNHDYLCQKMQEKYLAHVVASAHPLFEARHRK